MYAVPHDVVLQRTGEVLLWSRRSPAAAHHGPSAAHRGPAVVLLRPIVVLLWSRRGSTVVLLRSIVVPLWSCCGPSWSRRGPVAAHRGPAVVLLRPIVVPLWSCCGPPWSRHARLTDDSVRPPCCLNRFGQGPPTGRVPAARPAGGADVTAITPPRGGGGAPGADPPHQSVTTRRHTAECRLRGPPPACRLSRCSRETAASDCVLCVCMYVIQG